MRRPWGYSTHLIDYYHPNFWVRLDAFIESGLQAPLCIKCGQPVLVKPDCEPTCLDCQYGRGRDRDLAEATATRKWPSGRPPIPCWGVFKRPLETLAGPAARLPDHLCEFILRSSTLRWAADHLRPSAGPVPQDMGMNWVPTDPDYDYWQLRWPLPVGAAAIRARAADFASGIVPMEMFPALLRDAQGRVPDEILTPTLSIRDGRIVFDEGGAPLSYALPQWVSGAIAAAGTELAVRAPFEGDEHAIWAQRLQVGGRALDVFGLVVPDHSGPSMEWARLRAKWSDGPEIDLRGRFSPTLRNCLTVWNRSQGLPDGRPGRKLGRVINIEQLRTAKRDLLSQGVRANNADIANEANVSEKTAARVLSDAGCTWDDL